MTNQLPLFDLEPNVAPQAPTTFAKGPRGLLLALVRQGLDPDALEPAARLALLLDSERVDR